MALSTDDILRSEVWREAVAAIDAQLWAELGLARLEDDEALRRIRYCRWAMTQIVTELERRMRTFESINTRALRSAPGPD